MFDPSKIPTKEEVLNGIKILSTYQWPTFDNTTSIEQHIKIITNKLTECFNIIPDLMYIHDGKSHLPANLFRARALETFMDTSLISEYSYKPINLTTEIQRCNFPFKPVFYCSNDAGTALLENIKAQPLLQNKRYLVSKWIITNDLNTKIVPYLYGDLPEENAFKLFAEKALNAIPIIFQQKLSDDQVLGLRMYLDFLATAFTTNGYSLSATIAHRLLYSEHKLRTDLFLYPSIQTDKRSINIAIHPNYVDTNMRLVRIYSIEVKDIDQENLHLLFKIDKYAEINNCIIEWKNIDPNDKNYQDSVKEDFNYRGTFDFNQD